MNGKDIPLALLRNYFLPFTEFQFISKIRIIKYLPNSSTWNIFIFSFRFVVIWENLLFTLVIKCHKNVRITKCTHAKKQKLEIHFNWKWFYTLVVTILTEKSLNCKHNMSVSKILNNSKIRGKKIKVEKRAF